ncbi:hypothetical protein Pla86_08720 [Planctomycetes bacterium Pla86]|uniref:Uncharacterized protein n=2 Tax=Engelhardtia mirabilis TaxID=2528011 RepID=A0A518BFP5_9BACT|nr:hypothetical protein Pla133_08730 [Planctomycetes bacterium Pla133]QDV00133.1 hypothetical protein Pla86_08720 [Planctomycetes bacterium Pla86]
MPIWVHGEESELRGFGIRVNGSDEGLWCFFDDDEQLRAVGPLVDGAPSGRWEYFDDQGTLERAGSQVHGTKVGPWYTSYGDGAFHRAIYQFDLQLDDGARIEEFDLESQWLPTPP